MLNAGKVNVQWDAQSGELWVSTPKNVLLYAEGVTTLHLGHIGDPDIEGNVVIDNDRSFPTMVISQKDINQIDTILRKLPGCNAVSQKSNIAIIRGILKKVETRDEEIYQLSRKDVEKLLAGRIMDDEF